MELSANPELAPAWLEIRNHLRRVVGDSTFELWLSGLRITDWSERRLTLAVPPDKHAWVAKRFGRIVETCIRAVVGPAVEVAFATPGERAAPSAAATPQAGGDLNPRYSFEQFVIGDGNRFAHAAALAVAEHPGGAWNPLFLHAPPGLGKTHLLHAIGNFIAVFGGGARVRYATVEAFTNHFISALSTRSIEQFKRAYRDVDVLLIDDVQFLANKTKTEEEFFHTFNAVHAAGCQLVLTADRLPRQLANIEERLRERFASGLVVEIEPPDLATRLTILRKRAALDSVQVSDAEVLRLIAERVTDNVRALEGALIRIVAHHSLTGRPIDAAFARHILDEIHPAPTAAVTVEQIQSVVAQASGITATELVSKSREARIAWPRQLAIHLARELTGASLTELGAAFGGRNHATVLHACRRVAERVREDRDAAAQLDQLERKLRTA